MSQLGLRPCGAKVRESGPNGWERSDSDLLSKALAASAERTAERKKSMVAPLESRARYK